MVDIIFLVKVDEITLYILLITPNFSHRIIGIIRGRIVPKFEFADDIAAI